MAGNGTRPLLPPASHHMVPRAIRSGHQRSALSDKSKVVAALLQIFLGGFGIGRFYLGYTMIGVLQIVVTVLTFGLGALWGVHRRQS